jgi:hypothetical protein
LPYVLAHDRTLHITQHPPAAFKAGSFATSLDPLNSILPAHAFARACVHELLHQPHHPPPVWVAFEIVRHLLHQGRQLVWFDPLRQLNPAALFAHQVAPSQLLLARPPHLRDTLWAIRQCLASPAVAAVVAPIQGKLTPASVRQLQLAAESQSASVHAPIALLLRPFDSHARTHAAACRLLIEPAPSSSALTRRWKIQLIHGHGGLLHQPVLIERHHAPCLFATDLLYPNADLFDRPPAAPAARPIESRPRRALAG